ncbi:MAG: 4-hydroxybenzoyl-CoA reductase subunit beta [Gammaproteobacteria bacterium]
MEYMPDFAVLRPSSLAELTDLRREHAHAQLLAGGTDLIVNIRRGIAQPERLIELNGIAELRRIERLEDNGAGGLRIGAAVTLAKLIEDPLVRETYPIVVDAAREVAAATHREVATVGGNLCLDTRCVFYNQSEWWRRSNDYCLKSRGDVCHVAPKGNHCFAAFSGDLAPALIALGAQVEIVGTGGERTLPLQNIYADDGMAHLLLAKDECLVAVRLPSPAGLHAGYAKVRVRGAIDFPLVGVAVALRRQGEALSELRVALTGTNSRPILVQGTQTLLGQPFDEKQTEQLVALLAKQIQPMNSTFTPAGHRRKALANLTRSLIARLFDAADGNRGQGAS